MQAKTVICLPVPLVVVAPALTLTVVANPSVLTVVGATQ